MMEEVLEQLEATLITPDNNDEERNSYKDLYKNWGRLGNQEERRKELLEIQKSNRNDKIDKFRGILDLVKIDERNIFKPYSRAHYRPSIYVSGFSRSSQAYNNVLMLSEWLVEKPADFCENWFVVPCPKGIRMLTVASQGSTKFYTRFGHFRFDCRTALPGGNPCEPFKNRCCILDCFYSEKSATMYILDILAWNNQNMTDGETEFRQYWLKSQLTELPALTTVNKKNKIVFKLLPMVPCTPDSFNEFMMTYPQFEDNNPVLDGLLFYHRKAHYVSGETPLVGWLFPYMVPEVLGSDINVHQTYLNGKPLDYVNQAEFIQKFDAKMNKRRPRSRRASFAMDTTAPVVKPDNATSPSASNDAEVTEMEEKSEIKAENMEPDTTAAMEEHN